MAFSLCNLHGRRPKRPVGPATEVTVRTRCHRKQPKSGPLPRTICVDRGPAQRVRVWLATSLRPPGHGVPASAGPVGGSLRPRRRASAKWTVHLTLGVTMRSSTTVGFGLAMGLVSIGASGCRSATPPAAPAKTNSRPYLTPSGGVDYAALRKQFGEPNKNLVLNPNAIDVGKTTKSRQRDGRARRQPALHRARQRLARAPGFRLHPVL